MNMATARDGLQRSRTNLSEQDSRSANTKDMTEFARLVQAALTAVHDPEIPPCSIVDLGMVERVAVSDARIEVDLLPTFAGCPALDVIEADVRAALDDVADTREVRVRFVYKPPWTSDRITERGRDALRTYGVTPAVSVRRVAAPTAFVPLSAVQTAPPAVACPFCGSGQTVLESSFGPTLCRSIHFCRSCRNPFEAFKAKTN